MSGTRPQNPAARGREEGALPAARRCPRTRLTWPLPRSGVRTDPAPEARRREMEGSSSRPLLLEKLSPESVVMAYMDLWLPP